MWRAFYRNDSSDDSSLGSRLRNAQENGEPKSFERFVFVVEVESLVLLGLNGAALNFGFEARRAEN